MFLQHFCKLIWKLIALWSLLQQQPPGNISLLPASLPLSVCFSVCLSTCLSVCLYVCVLADRQTSPQLWIGGAGEGRRVEDRGGVVGAIEGWWLQEWPADWRGCCASSSVDGKLWAPATAFPQVLYGVCLSRFPKVGVNKYICEHEYNVSL